MPRYNRSKHQRHRRRRNGLSKVKKDIKWLKQNVEFKFKQFNFNDIGVDTGGDMQLLNGIAQGDTLDTRNGDEITARRILIRGFFDNSNGTPTDCLVRIILCRQLLGKASTPTMNDILDTSASDPINRAKNMDNKTDWKIYADHTFAMDNSTHSLIPFKMIYKLNNVVHYNTSGVTSAQIETNGLYLLTMSTVTAGANAPTYSCTSRYSYCDS